MSCVKLEARCVRPPVLFLGTSPLLPPCLAWEDEAEDLARLGKAVSDLRDVSNNVKQLLQHANQLIRHYSDTKSIYTIR
jgi:hypothetical protein